MSARPRTADGALRDMLASMSMLQLANAANAAEISKPLLIAYMDGRTTLSDLSKRRLGDHLYTGRYFVKREEQRA